MAKMVIEESTLKGLADALRSVTGETRTYTPTEMIEAVTNIMETGTYILVDEAGTEIPAVFVESKQTFTATPNDIRIGMTAVTDSGVTVGEKEIPAYNTYQGYRVIPAGSAVKHHTKKYQYTKLQALICSYNTSLSDSTSTEKVAIDGKVYAVKSSIPIAQITTNAEDGAIEFGVSNDTTVPQILWYFYYKEEV